MATARNSNGVITNDPLFWKLEDIEDTYWRDYISTRPTYDDKIMRPIREYHAQHSASFKDAIDIGAGPGEAAEALSSLFERVVASDNDPRSLTVGTQRLSHIPKSKLEFCLSSGEDILQHYQPSSMDLVANAEGFPLMDTETSLRNFHTLLRPNGTLAIWFYGRMNFSRPSARSHCQPILDRIMDAAFRRIVSGCGPDRQRTWKRAIDGMSSWLDYIPLREDQWQDVRRHKWNPHMNLPFFGPGACDFEVTPTSSVSENETVTSETDQEFWRKDLDIDGVRRFVAAAFPWPATFATPNTEMEDGFRELQIAMGGPKAVHAFSWPAVLILASKKG